MQGEEECPTWFISQVSNGTVSCKCGDSLGGIVLCDQDSNSSMLNYGYCVTYDESSNTTVAGWCPYNYHTPDAQHNIYVKLPQNINSLNNFMCGGLNRTGLSCGQCQPGLGPTVFSYTPQCLQCLDSGPGWLLYVFLATFPTTVLFFIIIICQIRITSARLNLFIFVCQVLTCKLNLDPHSFLDISAPIRYIAVTLITIYGIWNLDFARYIIPPFCVSTKLSTVQAISLEYIVAFYPLILFLVLYICIQLHARDCRVLVYLTRPFHKCGARIGKRWDPNASLIHSFAAFLILSYSKIMLVSSKLLSASLLFSSTGKRFGSLSFFYNPRDLYFSVHHLPYGILAIFVLIIFIVLPLLLLLLYPTRAFQRCLGYCNVRWDALRAFVDAFQGYYKDGSAGTHDWRYLSGLYLLLRIITIINFPFTFIMFMVRIVSLIVGSLLFALLRPYKENWINVWDSIALALFSLAELTVMYNLLTSTSQFVITSVLAVVPLLYICVYTSYKVLFQMGLLQRCSLIQKFTTSASKNYFTPARVDSDDQITIDDLPDRVAHPEHYESLLPTSQCEGKRGEDSLYGETDTLPVCGHSLQRYGSV